MRPRFIVDNPRGPKGGNNDVRHVFTDAGAAKRNVKRGTIVNGIQLTGRILELDLDDLAEVGAEPFAKYQHAERMMVKWSQFTLELQAGLADSGPLFADARTGGELAAIPELRRADMKVLAEAFARWTMWRNGRRKDPYAEELGLGDAIRSVLAKIGEAAR